MSMDLAFTNGRLVTPSGIVPGSIGVQDGRIALITEQPIEAAGTKTVAAHQREHVAG